MNIKAFFAVIRLMLSILFRFTPLQATKPLGLERNTMAITSATDEVARGLNVTPIDEGKQRETIPSTDDRHLKAA